MDTDFGTKDCLVLILAMVANPKDWYEVDVFQVKSGVESCKNSDCKQTADKCKQTADEINKQLMNVNKQLLNVNKPHGAVGFRT